MVFVVLTGLTGLTKPFPFLARVRNKARQAGQGRHPDATISDTSSNGLTRAGASTGVGVIVVAILCSDCATCFAHSIAYMSDGQLPSGRGAGGRVVRG